MTRQYKAFISYSWSDKEWGQWLHNALETYRAPKGVADGRTLHPIFKDREEQAAGGSISGAIETALAASEFLIVICSPRSAKSQWVNREVAWFKTHRDKSRVLALIVEGEPGHATEDCFPKALTHKIGPDLQATEELEDAPLAADARPEGDGKRGAKLKLAAALHGVVLDDLVKRDDRRRAIRRRWAMSGMAAGMAALGGLSLFAFNQRDAAVVARNDAVKARDDAEGLIELILGDLKSDLEGYGTLKSVTQIGNRAIGYYEGQDVKALTPDQLGRRARVLLMLGEADNKRGDLTAALARYQTAAATTSEQLARDPDNAQRIFDHAQSVFWVGYIAWQRGDHAKAKEQFTEYHRLATRLVEIDPENDDWQAELEYSYSNLGTLAMDEGEAAEAEGWFRKSLEITLAQLEKGPDDPDRVWAAGQSLQWLADSLHRQSKLALARSARLDEITLYEKSFAQFPANNSIRLSMSVAQYRLAQIETASGRLIEALEAAQSAAANADEILALDPKNADYLERVSTAYAIAGEGHSNLGQTDEAREAFRRSIAIAEELAHLEGSVTKWNGLTLARPKIGMALLDVKAESLPTADLILAEVEEHLRELVANDSDPIILRHYCAAIAARARIDGKESRWRQIVDRLGAEPENHGLESLTLLIEAHSRLGETAKAIEIATRLFRAGFRHPDLIKLFDEFPDLKAAVDRQMRLDPPK